MKRACSILSCDRFFPPSDRRVQTRPLFPLLVTFSLAIASLRADQVRMQNGDQYFGQVSILTTNTLLLQSDVLGTVLLPRAKLASITFGSNVSSEGIQGTEPARAQVAAPATTTNISPEAAASLRKLAAHTNLIQQVQSRFLADAGPEANAKFNELMNGLTSGKLSINDLRVEAKKSVDQLRELQRGSGESSSSLDTYLSILDHFLKEALVASTTNAPRLTPPPAAPDKENE